MGNSAGKEQRPSPHSLRSTHGRSLSSSQIHEPSSSSAVGSTDNASPTAYSSRQGKRSRPDLSSLLGIGTNGDRNADGLDGRRETKQEREARKIEKERINRERDRERSMREESVDGGFLVTQGVYIGIEDYNKAVVRQLMIERRIAPFWRGLNDHSSAWTENQLVAAARGLPIPAADEIPSQELQRPFPMNDTNLPASESNLSALTIPIISRSPSYNSDSSSNLSPSRPTFSFSSPSNTTSNLLRGRAKTLASLTTSSKNIPQSELTPREVHLPNDPWVNGQPVEACLYKDASECPICFLYYPPYLNRTRCCDQAICSECFVQIKRPDPHAPEHAEPTNPQPPPSLELGDFDSEIALVSEPAACPFCVQPEFGITYNPPPFRRGLTYVNQLSSHPLANATSAMSSSSSLGSLSGRILVSETANRRRAASISANSPIVVTTDRVRPDWAMKLATARANIARRSAAATALHAAAYLMGNRSGSAEGRNFAGLSRRAMLRRGTGADSPSGIGNSSQLNMLALMSERLATSARGEGTQEEASPSMIGPPRGSSRRSRVDDLEDMMLMEAIRLSLASEEERRKKEEKQAKKQAKKNSKEEKKAEKAARKAGPYPPSTNPSATTLESPQSGIVPSENGKGKAVQLEDPAGLSEPDLSVLHEGLGPLEGPSSMGGQTHADRHGAQLTTNDSLAPYGISPYKPSHLRTLSNVSSSASSVADSMRGIQKGGGSSSSFEVLPHPSGVNIPHVDLQENFSSGTPTGGGTGLEPMFNFRSLAAMIGVDEKNESGFTGDHVDHIGNDTAIKNSERGQKSTANSHGLSNASRTEQSENSYRDEVAEGPAVPHVTVEPVTDSGMASKERAAHGMNNEEMQREMGRV